MFQALLKMLGRNTPPAPVPLPRTITRHPLNAPGDFYVDDGCCMTCGLAEGEAPDLVASVEVGHCYYKKQPSTPEEVEQAIRAMFMCGAACHIYGGTDPAILRRLQAEGLEEQCDHPLADIE